MTRRSTSISGLGFVIAGVLLPYLLLLLSRAGESRLSDAEGLTWWNGFPLSLAGCIMLFVAAIKNEALFRRLVVGLCWGTVPLVAMTAVTLWITVRPLMHGTRGTIAVFWNLNIGPILALMLFGGGILWGYLLAK